MGDASSGRSSGGADPTWSPAARLVAEPAHPTAEGRIAVGPARQAFVHVSGEDRRREGLERSAVRCCQRGEQALECVVAGGEHGVRDPSTSRRERDHHGAPVVAGTSLGQAGMRQPVDEAHPTGGCQTDDTTELVDRAPGADGHQTRQRRRRRVAQPGRSFRRFAHGISGNERHGAEQRGDTIVDGHVTDVPGFTSACTRVCMTQSHICGGLRWARSTPPSR